MKQRKRIWIASALIALMLLVVATSLEHHFSQQRNLTAAREAGAILNRELSTNAKFTQVRYGEYTGDGGKLLIVGTVTDSAGLDELRRAVSDLKLSIPVKWMVTVSK